MLKIPLIPSKRVHASASKLQRRQGLHVGVRAVPGVLREEGGLHLRAALDNQAT